MIGLVCRCLLILVTTWYLSAACPQLSIADEWVRPPSEAQKQQTPGLVHETFTSAAMQTTVGYSVVLPPSYKAGNARYPVVYWLHGGGGNESSSLYTAQSWAEAYKKKTANEVILVYPNGFRSGYMDHADGKIMVESMIIRELIPRIDRRFRTIAERASRAVHGFSMGASGSLKFVFKYPDMFCSAVAFGGGAIDLANTKNRFVLDILERNLRSDPELIQQNNTYHFLNQNYRKVKSNRVQLMLVCGANDSWLKSALTFREALHEKQIACDLRIVPDVGHSLRQMIDAEGETVAAFQDVVFRQSGKPQSLNDQPLTLNESYFSYAEGRRQRFQVVLPPEFNAGHRYPLFVQIFGGNIMPTKGRPFIRIRPTARGVWGYRSMSRYDVLQAIERTKQLYNVDEDRIYLTGTSAGATGAMHVAAQRPDVFAAVVPLVAFGNDLPVSNFANLPLRCEHGVNDWTSAIGNVRVQFQKLKKLNYDAQLHEHPTAGHGVRVPPPTTMDWLFSQKRNLSPNRIVYSCEHPRDGKAYWLRVEDLTDPHQIAKVDAKVSDDGTIITTTNVQQLLLNCNRIPSSSETITIDGTEIHVPPNSEDVTFERGDGWKIRPPTARKSSQRPYAAGSAANLFQGEPLLVVFGTGGNDSENDFLLAAAKVLARSGGPTFKGANVQFPIRADSELTDADIKKYNLLLIGTSKNNSVVGRLAGKLPLRVLDNVLYVADRRPLPLAGSVLSLNYFNPDQPQRLIYIVSPFLDASHRGSFVQNPRRFLAGSDGFKMIDQPDLLVRGIDLKIRAEMQFGRDWKFLNPPGSDRPVPSRFADRSQLGLAYATVMQKTADVSFGLWWGPEDKGRFGGYDFNWLPTFDPQHYSLADYRVRRRETETMLGTVTGAELLDIYRRWISTKEIISWPVVQPNNISEDRNYRIVLPMDLVPKLGDRHKTLSEVSIGPEIMPEHIAQQVFGK